MAWKPGPLPPDTWGWGGVVPVGMTTGFWFADFQGSFVKACPGDLVIQPQDVVWYDNSLTLPPPTPPTPPNVPPETLQRS